MTRIWPVVGQPAVQIQADDGPRWFTVRFVENFSGELGCEDEWVAYLQPVRTVPTIAQSVGT
jgi:hypothetical protein